MHWTGWPPSRTSSNRSCRRETAPALEKARRQRCPSIPVPGQLHMPTMRTRTKDRRSLAHAEAKARRNPPPAAVRYALRHPGRRHILVCRPPVTPRHRRIEHPEVDPQLGPMMRRVRDKRRANDVRAGRGEHDPAAQAKFPRLPRLLPCHLLQRLAQLSAQFIEEANTLLAAREPWLGRTRTEGVEFVARHHHQPETGELRQMRGELAKRAGLGVRAPVYLGIGAALEHAPRGRQLGFEIRKQERDRRLLSPSLRSGFRGRFPRRLLDGFPGFTRRFGASGRFGHIVGLEFVYES